MILSQWSSPHPRPLSNKLGAGWLWCNIIYRLWQFLVIAFLFDPGFGWILWISGRWLCSWLRCYYAPTLASHSCTATSLLSKWVRKHWCLWSNCSTLGLTPLVTTVAQKLHQGPGETWVWICFAKALFFTFLGKQKSKTKQPEWLPQKVRGLAEKDVETIPIAIGTVGQVQEV